MVTPAQIQKWFPETVTRFAKVFPFLKEAKTEIMICSKDNCEEMHRIAVECSQGKKSEYMPNTCGEVLVGPGGCYMLLYPWDIENKKHFQRVLWHELGHRCDYFFNAAFRDYVVSHFDNDDPICNGYSIWGEFIAEIMYYKVADEAPEEDYVEKALELKQLLVAAIDNGHIMPYSFGHYAAMVMEDPTIDAVKNSFPDRFDYYLSILREPVAQAVWGILKTLDRQLCKDDFWIASNEFMTELGYGCNDLWDTCRWERMSGLLQ